MKAAHLSKLFGDEVIGAIIETPATGAEQASVAEVLEVQPDPSAPEIALQVKDLNTRQSIGVFWDEEIHVVRWPTCTD